MESLLTQTAALLACWGAIALAVAVRKTRR